MAIRPHGQLKWAISQRFRSAPGENKPLIIWHSLLFALPLHTLFIEHEKMDYHRALPPFITVGSTRQGS